MAICPYRIRDGRRSFRQRANQRRRLILEESGASDFTTLTSSSTPDFDSSGIVTMSNTFNNHGVFWSSDGKKLFIGDLGDFDGIHTITCTTAYVPDSQTLNSGTKDLTQLFTNSSGCLFTEDGLTAIQFAKSVSKLASATLSVAWDPTTGVDNADDFGVTDSARTTYACFGDDGNKIFVCDGNSDVIDVYDLSVPYTIDTNDMTGSGKSDYNFIASTSIAGWSTRNITCFCWNEDGTQFIIGTNNGGELYVGTVTQPYDLSTFVEDEFKTSMFPVGNAEGVHCRDGHLAIVAGTAERIFIYDF